MSFVFENPPSRPSRKKPGRVQLRQDHVQRLCAEHEIDLVVSSSSNRAYANVKERTVRCRPITKTRSYYLALHEIAHLVQGHDFDAAAAPQEAAAWQWAYANAIEPPTKGIGADVLSKIWHYILTDIARSHDLDVPWIEPVAPASDPMWNFIASLMTDPAKSLREMTKVLAYAGTIPAP